MFANLFCDRLWLPREVSAQCVIIVVSIACCSLLRAAEIDVNQARHIDRIQRLGGIVTRVENGQGLAVTLKGKQCDDEFFAELRSIQGLRSLTADGTSLTNRGCALIWGLSGLEGLVIANSRVSDDGLAGISKLAALKRLTLRQLDVTDEAMGSLADLRSLRELELAYTAIGDAGLKRLAKLTALRKLVVSQSRITDDGLAVLKEMPTLEIFSIQNDEQAPSVTDIGMARIARCTNLEFLSVTSNEITDGGLAELENLRHLRSLRLTSRRLTDKGVVRIASLPRLKKLWLYSPGIGDSVAPILAASSIQDLGLTGTSIGDAGLESLSESKTLKSLYIERTRVTSNGLESFQSKRPSCRVHYRDDIE
jgi:hypothetical protein